MGALCAKCRYVAPLPAGAPLTECPKCGEPYATRDATPATPVTPQQHGDNDKIIVTLSLIAVVSMIVAVLELFGSSIIAALCFLIFTTAMAGIAIVNAINQQSVRR